MHDRQARVKFLALWLFVLALKLLLAVRLPLFGDEAFYWLEGQHLAWAYSDLPGATAWLARLGVALAGNDVFFLRLPFVLLAATIPWSVIAIARHLGQGVLAWQAGMLALLLPLMVGLGPLALPDVPLTLASILCFEATLALLQRVGAAAAIRLALGLALGAFSHYRFALPLAMAALALFADARGRALLRRPIVWLALAAGALAWWPLLQWNLDHAGAGISFQVLERNPWRFHAGGALFVPIQWLLLTPLLAPLLIGVAWRVGAQWRRQRDTRVALVAIGAGGLFLIYMLAAFFVDRERVSFHWPLPAYLPLLALAPALMQGWTTAWRRMLWLTLSIGALVTLAFMAMIASPAARERLAAASAYPENFAGWSEVADAARQALASMPQDSPLLADNFMLGAQLGFALDGRRVQVLEHPLNRKHGRSAQLALWQLLADALPDAGLLVVEDSAVALKDRLVAYVARCERYGSLPSPQVLNVDHGRKRYLLYSLTPTSRPRHCVLPALAWIDTPEKSARVDSAFDVSGWAFKDGAGISAVDITVDGQMVARANYGQPLPHVAAYWRISIDPAHPHVGFRARIDAATLAQGRHWLGLVLHGQDGSVEPWPEQPIVILPQAR